MKLYRILKSVLLFNGVQDLPGFLNMLGNYLTKPEKKMLWVKKEMTYNVVLFYLWRVYVTAATVSIAVADFSDAISFLPSVKSLRDWSWSHWWNEWFACLRLLR